MWFFIITKEITAIQITKDKRLAKRGLVDVGFVKV